MNEWVIFGCGYVGSRLARRLLAEGNTVRVCSRHPDKLAPLGALGARVQLLDATKSRAFGPAIYGAKSPMVVYSIPPIGNMPAGEPVRRAAEAAIGVGAQRFVYLSSTAVYGPTSEGEVVDEDTPLAISDAEAGVRIPDEGAVEGAHLSGLSTILLRLSAVYGPGRGVRERLKAGNYKLIDDGEHMFSRVHVDDVVGIILAAVERAPNPAIYCVSDDRPTTQREYADWLVQRMGVPPPSRVASLAPGMPRRPVRNRAVSNQRLKRELGYGFRYPSYLEGELAVEAETTPTTDQIAPTAAAPKSDEIESQPKISEPRSAEPIASYGSARGGHMRNLLILGWKGSRTGRESISGAHFQEVVAYLTAQQKEGRIQSFEPIFFDPHGADLQGFFLIRGAPQQLDALQNNEAWIEHVTRALLHLEGTVHVRGTGGEGVMQLMGLWMKNQPK